MLLLCGCVTINLNHTLYRDGSFDLSIEVKSDNEMFLNVGKEKLEQFSDSSDFWGINKGTLIENEEGIKYIFERMTFDNFSTEYGNSLIESLGIKKEFKFPYYYYTITLKNEDDEDLEYYSEYGVSLNYVLEPFGKIIDTNGIYVGEDKKAVKFNLLRSKEYYVTFRDFFIFSWLGGASKIMNRENKKVELSFDSENKNQEISTAQDVQESVNVENEEEKGFEEDLAAGVYEKDIEQCMKWVDEMVEAQSSLENAVNKYKQIETSEIMIAREKQSCRLGVKNWVLKDKKTRPWGIKYEEKAQTIREKEKMIIEECVPVLSEHRTLMFTKQNQLEGHNIEKEALTYCNHMVSQSTFREDLSDVRADLPNWR